MQFENFTRVGNLAQPSMKGMLVLTTSRIFMNDFTGTCNARHLHEITPVLQEYSPLHLPSP
jgi:hypothetical protein